MDENKKLFSETPKNENVRNYYSYCIIMTLRKLSFSKEEKHDVAYLAEIESIMKDMNNDLFERVKKVLAINKKDYDDELKKFGMTNSELRMVLGGFNIKKEYSKGLIGLILANNLIKYK